MFAVAVVLVALGSVLTQGEAASVLVGNTWDTSVSLWRSAQCDINSFFCLQPKSKMAAPCEYDDFECLQPKIKMAVETSKERLCLTTGLHCEELCHLKGFGCEMRRGATAIPLII